MESYQVPKEQAKIFILVPPAKPAEASIFLAPFAEHHRGQETVADVFRASNPFMPVQDADGRPFLVRKKAVRWIRVLDYERVEWVYLELKTGAPKTTVRLEFEDGAALVGDIFATTPAGHQRVSDVLNLTGPFLHLEAKDGMYIVNLGHVTTVQIVEESSGDAR